MSQTKRVSFFSLESSWSDKKTIRFLLRTKNGVKLEAYFYILSNFNCNPFRICMHAHIMHVYMHHTLKWRILICNTLAFKLLAIHRRYNILIKFQNMKYKMKIEKKMKKNIRKKVLFSRTVSLCSLSFVFDTKAILFCNMNRLLRNLLHSLIKVYELRFSTSIVGINISSYLIYSFWNLFKKIKNRSLLKKKLLILEF